MCKTNPDDAGAQPANVACPVLLIEGTPMPGEVVAPALPFLARTLASA